MFRNGGQLIDGGRAIKIASHEEGAAAVLLEAQGKFAGGGGLSGSVQSAEEDACRGIEIQRRLVTPEELGQFVVKNFDDLLAGLDGLEDVLADGSFLDPFNEGLGDFVFDV